MTAILVVITISSTLIQLLHPIKLPIRQFISKTGNMGILEKLLRVVYYYSFHSTVLRLINPYGLFLTRSLIMDFLFQMVYKSRIFLNHNYSNTSLLCVLENHRTNILMTEKYRNYQLFSPISVELSAVSSQHSLS